MDIKNFIEKYLQNTRVMQIATIKNGKPWVCTVNFAYDEKWNFYWMSLRSTRHSQEIAQASRVAGTIVMDPSIIQGLQFEGEAYEVEKDQLSLANTIYEERYGHKPERLEEAMSQDPSVRTYYKVIPEKIVLFDKVNFPMSPRQELKLK